MSSCIRVRVTGTIELDMVPQRAFDLFTPNGERVWAHDWRPEFPNGETGDVEVGLVFETCHTDRRSIWTVVRCEPGKAIAYSTTTPGHRAGTVAVTCQLVGGGTTVTVSYDITALRPEENDDLKKFEAHFPEFLGEWELSIARAMR